MDISDIFIKQTIKSNGIVTEDYVSIDTLEDIAHMGREKPQRIISPTNFVDDRDLGGVDFMNHNVSSVWTIPEDGSIVAMFSKGDPYNANTPKSYYCVRPHVKLNINNILNKSHPLGKFKISSGIKCVVFENLVYPQSRCDVDLSRELNQAKNEHKLLFTGRSYIIDANNTHIAEVSYNNQRYVSVGSMWFKVEPIIWKINNWSSMPREIDPNKNQWWEDWHASSVMDITARDGILALPYNTSSSDNFFEWQNSLLRAYLNGYDLHKTILSGNGDKTKMCETNHSYIGYSFLEQALIADKEFFIEKSKEEKEAAKAEKEKRNQNPYNVTIDDTPLSAKEQMKFYLDSGKTFMLHGPSGVGKTRRVQELDPNCVMLQLRNGILPEEIIGKTGFEDGKPIWIEPTWYTRLCQVCKNDPDHNHILFIDEITNVHANEQSLVFHIVLERSIDGNIGKLPKNCIVVAAGNNPEESEAAYNMPEPLFRRFEGHINLELDIENFLEWGSELRKDGKTKIHPLIAAFVAENGDNVFYSKYDPDKPPKHAIDPRGWEQISNIIYANNNTLRQKLLADKVGEKIANDLIKYARLVKVTSLDEILSNKVDYASIPKSSNGKYMLVCSLRHCKEKEVDAVRQFINRYLGKDNLARFDTLWIDGKQKRKDLIEKLDKEEKERQEKLERERQEKLAKEEKERLEQEAKKRQEELEKEREEREELEIYELNEYKKRVMDVFDKYRTMPNCPKEYLQDFMQAAKTGRLSMSTIDKFDIFMHFLTYYGAEQISAKDFEKIKSALLNKNVDAELFEDGTEEILSRYDLRKKSQNQYSRYYDDDDSCEM